MRLPRSLQLVVTVLLSLDLLTTCLARTTHESTPGASGNSASILAEDAALGTVHLGGKAASILKPRSVGFQEYLDIGSGWNMYYSSWPSIALPVRTYIPINVCRFPPWAIPSQDLSAVEITPLNSPHLPFFLFNLL